MWEHLTTGFNPPLPGDENLVVRSLPGGGKTTFFAGDPNTLLLSGEPQGSSFIVGARCGFDTCKSWEDFERNVQALEQDAKANGDDRRFRSVTFDTIGQFIEKIFSPKWCSLNGVKEVEGFDFAKLAKFVMYWLRKLNEMGYAWHVSDHVLSQRVTVGKTEKIVVESVLSQSIRKLIDQECSQIITLELRDIRTDSKGKMLPVDQWTKECWATTKPGNDTSLANPKARVWIPQEFKVPSIEDDPNGYGFLAYEKVFAEAVERMSKIDASVRADASNVNVAVAG